MDNFDTSKHCLGNLCKKGHDWHQTGKSLRNLRKGECVECKRIRAKEERKTEVYKRRTTKRYQDNRDKIINRVKNYYQDNKERILQQAVKYREDNRNYIKQWKAEHYVRNKKIIRKRSKEYYQANREFFKAYCQRYQKTPEGKIVAAKARDKRRATKKLNHFAPYTVEQVKELFAKFDDCCAYCGKLASSVDHVIPIAKGGADAFSNLIPCCRSCNSSKGCKDIEEWYKSHPHFTKKRWQKILRILGLNEAMLGQLPLF